MKKGEKEIQESVYIMRHLQTALLGRPAIQKLELVARLNEITAEILKTSYPKLCSGLGEERRLKDAERYDARHRARVLSKLTPGQGVWIKDQGTSGAVVTSHSTPRSYIVEGPHGLIRRNRRHLVAMEPSTEPEVPEGDVVAEQVPPSSEESSPTPRTRFGRRVVKPDRLNL
uniref:(Atlantic silverside) hypothetical protein n=1 Tax=Menidia menidia TaxID=238744 RepID=A0A8S4BT03_9TELE|nr:unnamed protein product [Menidia menidia]